jgi:hypothetical protein
MKHLLWPSIGSFLVFFELGLDGLEGAVHVSEQFKHFGMNGRGRLFLKLLTVAAAFSVFVSNGFFAVRRAMLSVSLLHFVVVVIIIIANY